MKKFIIRIGIVLSAIVVLVLLAGLILPRAGSHPALENYNWQVIAHQGGNHLWPDNTLFAFEQATAAGVDVLEMDVHASSDGHLVVIHDDTVDRTTNGSGLVWELSLEEIQSLDAAYNWPHHIDTDEHPYRGQGIRVPTLEAVLQRFPDMPMVIEIKQSDPPIVDEFGRLLQQYDREQNTVVASFSPEVMQEFRQKFPAFATSGVEPEIRTFFVLTKLFAGWVYPPPMHVFAVPEQFGNLRVITPRFVSSAQRRGIEVQAWTINEREQMIRMLDAGVDGIITDEPVLLINLLESRGER
jgi:glycerophosphoryl diester phosphodiesterase